MEKLNFLTYLDKIHGGWYGKCIGGAAGAPFEGIKSRIEVEDFRTVMDADLPNDDLDLQLLWLQVATEKGSKMTAVDLADGWDKHCWYPFSEYGYFLKNYAKGIMPPLSGTFNNSFFNNGMGCPIRSEIWAMLSPNLPHQAMEYAAMDASLDHSDQSVQGEIFFAVVESLAFCNNDVKDIISKAIEFITDGSLYSCIYMILNSYKDGETFDFIYDKILLHHGHPDFSNSVQNIGFTVLALLFSNGDMRQAIDLALRCGYDTDCTCASAAAILGIVHGFSNINDDIKNLINDSFVIGIDVKRTDNSILSLARETANLGLSFGVANNNFIPDDIPQDIKIQKWEEIPSPVGLSMQYICDPCADPNSPCRFNSTVENNSDKPLKCRAEFSCTEKGMHLQITSLNLSLLPDEKYNIYNELTVPSLDDWSDSCMITCTIYNGDTQLARAEIGVALALAFAVHGVFTRALEKPPVQGHPSPHAPGCTLPSVECMCNNHVDINIQYLDEDLLLHDKAPVQSVIYSAEDLIPLQQTITAQGPVCAYLSCKIDYPKKEKVWIVVGNNDGFKIWLNGDEVMHADEMRYWTPVNNAELITLNEGENHLVFKLLRRGENVKFSFGLREYNGAHYHRNRWITGLTYKNIKEMDNEDE